MLEYILLLLFSFVLTYLIKEVLIKRSILAEVNHRSSHTVPTPAGGGIAIAIGWFSGLIYLYVNSQIENTLFMLLMLGIIIFAIGLADDVIKKVTPKTRLILQALVAITVLIILGGLDSINFVFYEITNGFITNIFAFLLIVWFINLYNFIDGIDGYASSEAIFLSISGFILFGGEHFILLGIAVFGFWLWNFPTKAINYKAKIFIGDSGSTLLGYNIAIFTLYYSNQSSENLWIWIALFSLFWIDATYTLLKRISQGKNPTHAHKEHFYQRLVQYGWSHGKVVSVSILINIFIFCMVYFISLDNTF